MSSFSSERDDASGASIQAHQVAAASDPDRPTRELLGNFGDLDSLFEQLAQPQVIELGNPLPDARYTPDRQRVGACPAAHNRALLGEGD